MVGAGDLKCYRSAADANNLGGAITATQIPNGSPNNLFINVSRAEQISGTDEYKCCYFKNTHATERMDNLKLWLSGGSRSSDTTIKWGWDSVARETVGFDGVNDYIDCGVETGLWSQSLTKFSFSFWIFPTAGWDTNTRDVVRHGNAGSASRFVCEIDSAVSGTIRFQVRNSADTTFSVAASTALTLNEWNFITCVYDSTLVSANVKIYVDKVQGATTANLTQTPNLSANLILGGSSNDFKGYMKGFRWFTTKALTQTEINDVYDVAETQPDPDYHLPLNEMGGNPDDNISGGAKQGILNGAYWNFDAQIIPNLNTEPGSIAWRGAEAEPSNINFRKISAGGFFPIWLWYHVEPGAESILNDSEIFSFKFNIPAGGTGSSGGGDPTGGGGGSGGGGNPPSSTNYKIAICGDWGCESETDDVISLIQDRDYDMLAGIGDNAYSSSDCWISRFNKIKSIFKISAYGNHEYSESGGTSPYKTFFGDNKTYYTFKFQNILFLVIDDNDFEDSGAPSLSVGGTQHNFIKNALTASLDDNTIDWRIALIHHPWFGSQSKHPFNEGDQVQRLHKLFQDNKVQFVVTGHNHNWQRTKQVVYNSGDPKSPTVVQSAGPYTATKKGIIHVVSGTGGHDSGSGLYGLSSQPGFQAYQNRTHNGIWEIVASNNEQTLTCKFVDIDGSTFDSFVITAE
jgi:hypothetical protein